MSEYKTLRQVVNENPGMTYIWLATWARRTNMPKNGTQYLLNERQIQDALRDYSKGPRRPRRTIASKNSINKLPPQVTWESFGPRVPLNPGQSSSGSSVKWGIAGTVIAMIAILITVGVMLISVLKVLIEKS